VQESVTYIVQKGDTLLGICRQQYGTADRLEEVEQLNGITDPDAIYVGQQLLLPQ
jgi:nucleoid-associated protein YgaU